METPGGIQSVTVLEEPGIYQLIFSSNLESAKEFQHWVFSEVLPSIRKSGSFSVGKTKELKRIALKNSTIDYIKAASQLDRLKDKKLKEILRQLLIDDLSAFTQCSNLPIQQEQNLNSVEEEPQEISIGQQIFDLLNKTPERYFELTEIEQMLCTPRSQLYKPLDRLEQHEKITKNVSESDKRHKLYRVK